MKDKLLKLCLILMSVAAATLSLQAQKIRPNPPVSRVQKPIIFAVLEGGTRLEPIAYLDKGKLSASVSGGDDRALIARFNGNYYKSGTAYRLIFGGGNAGTVTVKSSNAKAECSPNIATVTTKTTRSPLGGHVMGIATNGPSRSTAVFRRRPTAAEKEEIDALATVEFSKQKLTPKTLRFQNLTAMDLDNDGTAEFVGSYWVEIDRLTRGLLFLIASKAKDGKYKVGHSDYSSKDQGSVMGGEIKAVDDGIYHELMLDAYDVDGDGRSELFSYVPAFEGASFNVYKQNGGKWTRVFEGSNYHCAY